MVIPCLHQLTNLPKLVTEGGPSRICEAKLAGNEVEPCLAHVLVEVVGAGVRQLIIGLPESVLGDSFPCARHQEPQPNVTPKFS